MIVIVCVVSAIDAELEVADQPVPSGEVIVSLPATLDATVIVVLEPSAIVVEAGFSTLSIGCRYSSLP